jgi:hypothetical protein
MRVPKSELILTLQSGRQQRAAFAVLGALLVAPCARGLAQRASACAVNNTEGGTLSRGLYTIVFKTKPDSGGSSISGAVIVRASEVFRHLPPSRAEPAQWRHDGGSRTIAGGNVGPLRIGYEEPTNTAWLDSLPIPLGTNNVLLVAVDTNNRAQIAGQARVEPRLSLAPTHCVPGRTQPGPDVFAEALWARLGDTPRVRAFLDP